MDPLVRMNRHDVLEIVKKAVKPLPRVEREKVITWVEQTPKVAWGQFAIPEPGDEGNCFCPLRGAGLDRKLDENSHLRDDFIEEFDTAMCDAVEGATELSYPEWGKAHLSEEPGVKLLEGQ